MRSNLVPLVFTSDSVPQAYTVHRILFRRINRECLSALQLVQYAVAKG